MFADVESDSLFAQNHQKEARNYVRFFRHWIRNNFMSTQEGREIGEYRDYIMIVSPGQPKSEVRRQATDKDKAEYRSEWQQYQEGKEHQINGTPIELLPGLPSGMADMLKSLYIYSIEQMANLADVHMDKVGIGSNDLKSRAKAYLDKQSAVSADLKAENDALKAENAMLRAELAEKSALIDQLSINADKPPARKRKGVSDDPA